MRIVSYNVNGLRARLSPVRSLVAFLDALNADIVCLQETKLSRQELTADVAVAPGYESFFSCTRTVKKGKIGYSGVATFCRVGNGRNEALPLAADEGFSGLLHCPKAGKLTEEKGRVGFYEDVWNMTGLSTGELLRLDSEGRCVVTDHGSFVLFNIYGPRVQAGDSDRLQFKLDFFKALQFRWESLLKAGKVVVVVGDLNISPFAIDSCDPGPQFEVNPVRIWLRTLLSSGGGPFIDAFRLLHPNRKEAYTCWSQASGAEEFNYGTRIDLALIAGPCFHSKLEDGNGSHSFAACEVLECDILLEHKRVKADSLPRWAGGRSLKLSGSDHAPVYVKLRNQPPLEAHDVPSSAARFMPELRGRQQSIVSLFHKQPNGALDSGQSQTLKHGDEVLGIEPFHGVPGSHNVCEPCSEEGAGTSVVGTLTQDNLRESDVCPRSLPSVSSGISARKRAREDKSSTSGPKQRLRSQKCRQSSLQSFFTMRGIARSPAENRAHDATPATWMQASVSIQRLEELDFGASCAESVKEASEASENGEDEIYVERAEMETDEKTSTAESVPTEVTKDTAAEWQRIRQFMAANISICRGHGEPCVIRQVKKPGPNRGRGFYVCCRAQGPASNPEARCDHFEWASSRMVRRQRRHAESPL